MNRKEIKEFLETLHFHGYIDHDITKLENLIDDYYPQQLPQADASRSSSNGEKSLNDFILEALQVSEYKRKLPFKIQCPNGLEVYPSIKMKFENYGSPLLGDKLEAMHVTWRD